VYHFANRRIAEINKKINEENTKGNQKEEEREKRKKEEKERKSRERKRERERERERENNASLLPTFAFASKKRILICIKHYNNRTKK